MWILSHVHVFFSTIPPLPNISFLYTRIYKQNTSLIYFPLTFFLHFPLPFFFYYVSNGFYHPLKFFLHILSLFFFYRSSWQKNINLLKRRRFFFLYIPCSWKISYFTSEWKSYSNHKNKRSENDGGIKRRIEKMCRKFVNMLKIF